jgi:hypothetical protein
MQPGESRSVLHKGCRVRRTNPLTSLCGVSRLRDDGLPNKPLTSTTCQIEMQSQAAVHRQGSEPMKRAVTENYEIEPDELPARSPASMVSNALARFFGVPDRLAHNWLAGVKGIPVAEVMVLELIRHHELTSQQVSAITETKRVAKET